MKKIIIALLTAILLPVAAPASTLWFSGIVSANVVTNTGALVPVGTFTFTSPGFYFQTTAATTNNYMLTKLTFDGTNYFILPQVYQTPATPTNQLTLLTNTSYTVYASLSVSNGTAGVITNNITSQP